MMTDKNSVKNTNSISNEGTLVEKLRDAESTPGLYVEFDPDEAEQAGAFEESALNENDALESSADLIDSEQ